MANEPPLPRLFVSVMKRTNAPEDVLTECLAASLQEDPGLALDFLAILTSGWTGLTRVESEALQIQTQRNFPDAGCCVDMVFQRGGIQLGLENKLDSPQGERQLERYLDLGFERLAFLTRRPSYIEDVVLRHPQYLKPRSGRTHFMWNDFHAVVEKHARRPGSQQFTRALLALFIHLGFEPAHPGIGDLVHEDEQQQNANRTNFAKLWEGTRKGLRDRGWKSIGRGSIAELYLDKGSSTRVKRAWIDPTWTRGMLRVRLTPQAGVTADALMARIAPVPLPGGDDVQIRIETLKRKVKESVVDVMVPFKQLLGTTEDTERIDSRLAEFVLAVFDAAE